MIKEYDKRGNVVYRKYYIDIEEWFEYDFKNRCIKWKDSLGSKEWAEYDDENGLAYFKKDNTFGIREYWLKYDKNKELKEMTKQDYEKMKITKKEYEWIKFKKKEKEFNSRTPVSRFQLMDI